MRQHFARVAFWAFAGLALLAAYSLIRGEPSLRRRHGQELLLASSVLAAVTIWGAQRSRRGTQR
ncbi:MAG TPA: hypothetical protein VGP93_18025 [Polyangiaceae bacterium]|nr:hypothetical protein [Polyangiaceae bacterium]